MHVQVWAPVSGCVLFPSVVTTCGGETLCARIFAPGGRGGCTQFHL